MRDTGWFKSSRSTSGSDNCVEVRMSGARVRVRDSKRPHEEQLGFDGNAWTEFLASLRR